MFVRIRFLFYPVCTCIKNLFDCGEREREREREREKIDWDGGGRGGVGIGQTDRERESEIKLKVLKGLIKCEGVSHFFSNFKVFVPFKTIWGDTRF